MHRVTTPFKKLHWFDPANSLIPESAIIRAVKASTLRFKPAPNAQLSKSVGSPFAATTVQLLVSALVLLLITGGVSQLAALGGLPEVPWWHAIGGLASALYIVSGILLFPRLGAVVTIGLFIAGQMLASVVLDTFGILGVASQPFDVATALGTGAVLLGTVAIVKTQAGGQNAQPMAKLPAGYGWRSSRGQRCRFKVRSTRCCAPISKRRSRSARSASSSPRSVWPPFSCSRRSLRTRPNRTFVHCPICPGGDG